MQGVSAAASSQYVSLPTNAALQLALPQTLTMWVKPTTLDSNQNDIYDYGFDETAYCAGVTVGPGPSGQVNTQYSGSTSCSGTSTYFAQTANGTLTTNVWQF